MRSNHLTSKRMNLLSSTLPSTLQELDLSNNALGIDGIQQICKYLSLKTTYLSVLVLEDNQIRDTGANLILKTLLESKTIKVLNLSKNLVSDHCMENLSQLLRKVSAPLITRAFPSRNSIFTIIKSGMLEA